MILITRSRRESARSLRELELFKHCDEHELVRLQSLMTKIDFAAGVESQGVNFARSKTSAEVTCLRRVDIMGAATPWSPARLTGEHVEAMTCS